MFDAIKNRIRRIKENLIRDRENAVLLIAFDQLALVKLRIQTSGKDGNNTLFAPYTAGYAKSRKNAGYQTEYVDFTRTGRLWANIQPRIVESSVFSATVAIDGSEQRSNDIIAGARKKRGNILQPTQEELNLIRAANRQRILNAFRDA